MHFTFSPGTQILSTRWQLRSVVSITCGFSIWNLLHITYLAHWVARFLLDSYKVCEPALLRVRTVKITVLWHVTLDTMIDTYQHFGGICCMYVCILCTLKMEPLVLCLSTECHCVTTQETAVWSLQSFSRMAYRLCETFPLLFVILFNKIIMKIIWAIVCKVVWQPFVTWCVVQQCP